ncbi:MAG: hypothetical protein Q9168_004922 [Polycauliona sp. 1 TL-2023]
MPPRRKTPSADPPKQSSSTKKKTSTAAAASGSKTPPLQRKRSASKPLRTANTKLRLLCKKLPEEQEEGEVADTNTAEEKAAAR